MRLDSTSPRPHLLTVLIFLACPTVVAQTASQNSVCHNALALNRWTPTEKQVWQKVCQGAAFDFNAEPSELLPTVQSDVWQKRKIGSQFLQEILFLEPFRSALTRHGVHIFGAYFPDTVDLRNGHITVPLALRSSRFERGLQMTRLTADRFIDLGGSHFIETMDLNEARIRGSVFLRNVSFVPANPEDKMRSADFRMATIDGQLDLTGADFAGPLYLNSVVVGHALILKDCARFDHIDLRESTIGGRLELANRVKARTLDLGNAAIGQDLVIRHTKVDTAYMTAMSVEKGLVLNGRFGILNLSQTSVAGAFWPIEKDPNSVQESCPDKWRLDATSRFKWLNLDAFSYESIYWPAQNYFLQLLKETKKPQDERNIDPDALPSGQGQQAFEQFAWTLRRAGSNARADEVLYEYQDQLRKECDDWKTCVTQHMKYSVGYFIGIYPMRSILWWCLVLVPTGWIMLLATGENRRHTERIGRRIGLWFSLDYFLPFVRMSDRHFSDVDLEPKWLRWYFYGMRVVGYILVSIAIAGLSRVLV